MLRLLIQQSEDAVRAREGHDDRVELHGDLVDRHREALVKCKEGRQLTDRQASVPVNCQRTADDRADDIAQISQLCIDRHENVGEPVRLVGALEQGIIQLVEFLNRLLLMIEDLDDLLAGHHFLNISVHLAEISLLLDKIAS